MKSLTAFWAALAAFFLIVPAAAAAPGWTTYNPNQFAAAQQAGRTILVDVHADWCPTCRAQKPTLNKLRADPRLINVLFVTVDYDKQKDFLRSHRIPRQSTILVFKGTKETARSIAETNPARLRAAILAGV